MHVCEVDIRSYFDRVNHDWLRRMLRERVSLALGVMFLFGFLWGVLKIWGGANAISKGDPDGKAGIIAGIIIAAAAAIMGALFTIFGLSGASLTPTF